MVSSTEYVHNEKLKEGYQKFVISSIYAQRTKLWSKFDEDKHCKGSFVMWDKKNVRRSKKTLNYDVTPASDPSFTNVTEFERGRKRKRQEENCERSREKKLRNSGQSYSPYKCFPNRKTSMKTRSMSIPCDECRLDCNTKISEESRKKLFDTYWGLGEINKQRQYILNSIEIEPPARKRPRNDTHTERRNSIKHFLQGELVSQTMFLSTFAISRKVLRTAISKKEDGNLVAGDRRGKANSNVKYDEDSLNLVKNHIKLFPVMESHFCREHTKRQYLASNLNIRKIYELFKAKHPTTTIEEHYYRKIFTENFNLGFHIPCLESNSC